MQIDLKLPHPNPPRMYWGGNKIFRFPPFTSYGVYTSYRITTSPRITPP
jgi:hypothetical protein